MIPFNGNSRLLEDTLNFIEASLEVTTQSSYQSSLTSYHRFCVRYGVARCQAFPATKDLLAAYICTGATLFRLTFKTLKVYFYGLKHWHSIYGLNTEGFEDNVCKKCLRAAHKLCIKPVKAPRLPLTLPLLEKVMRKMDTTYSDPWELRTEKALLAFGFQSGTRPSVYAVKKASWRSGVRHSQLEAYQVPQRQSYNKHCKKQDGSFPRRTPGGDF